jgi:hypothetical protein
MDKKKTELTIQLAKNVVHNALATLTVTARYQTGINPRLQTYVCLIAAEAQKFVLNWAERCEKSSMT